MPLPRLTALPAHDEDAAFAAGFAAGYADGLRRASQRARAEAAETRRREADVAVARAEATRRATDAVAAAAARLTATADEVVAGVADTLTEGLVRLARAVVGVDLADPGHRATAAVHRALAGTDGTAAARPVTVRLHPDDVVALDAASVAAGVEIVADPAVRPGDAMAAAGPVLVDARIAEALDRIAAELVGTDAVGDPAGAHP
jgi:flagellar assembly protein FliH